MILFTILGFHFFENRVKMTMPRLCYNNNQKENWLRQRIHKTLVRFYTFTKKVRCENG